MNLTRATIGLVGAAALALFQPGCAGNDRTPSRPAPAPSQHVSESTGAPPLTSPAPETRPIASSPTPPADRPTARVETPVLLTKPEPADPRPVLRSTKSGTGIVVEDLKMGEGLPCLPGANVTIHVRGWAKGATEVFDDSRAKRPAEGNFPGHDGSPLKASLRDLMKGMREGIVGMQVGGYRRLRIPAEHAFGFVGLKNAQGEQLVPPDTDVVYEIELIAVDQKLVVPQ